MDRYTKLLDQLEDSLDHQLDKFGVQDRRSFQRQNPLDRPERRCQRLGISTEGEYKNLYEMQGDSPSWDVILMEEVAEAISAENRTDRITELLQVAAVAIAWAENIKRDGGKAC